METINGYSINDKSRLEAEMTNFKHKRNTSLAVGITLFAVSIIAIIVVVMLMLNKAMEMAESGSGSYSYEDVMRQSYGLTAIIYVLAFTSTIGEIIAAAGGISNHIKFANRRKTLQRLKEIEPNVEQF